MELQIDQIKIKKRVRKNLGDLSALMKSLASHGLMNPLIVNEKNVLIAGHRRLEAAKQLGWSTIAVQVNRTKQKLEMLELEMDENIQRKSLTPDELADGFRKIDRLKNPNILVRILRAIVNFFRNLFGRR